MITNTMMLPMQPSQVQATVSNISSSAPATPAEMTKSFGEFLADSLQQVDAQEHQVQSMNKQFMIGEVNVDQLMIASERALLSLQLTTQVRNKVVEAYQEVMRMQM
ncbi:flagellar hook-basal body complex protein FliE [Paenibacillus sp. ACRRX]|uniref:flagellar hook-basal body complex protein FliE n=1 Tax=unclassified Paenibacillus TaxID=185978 RepID=UPI001EF58E14|nr:MULTISPECIES: flagellar hook-basal body complex protein FliE [unclassified Paenibacillus]MCG7407499.1 flagellar hook-basal body complex protein FliE [Paenibacillus sp. ACRRX]MDK8180735.1 flagellar hook-basal body complex protein FliE [Paenibacillus sp. UMB4589-SE434]